MVSWETGATLGIGEHTRDRLPESRESTSTTIITEEGPMGPKEEGATHQAMKPGITDRGSQRILEEVLLAADLG